MRLSLTFCIYYIIKIFLKQRNAITRKFLDNLNNLNGFRGRHQTVKIHVQEELHTHIFSRGAGVQEPEKPPDSRMAIGGMVTGKSHFDFSMLLFSADFPTVTKSRRKRPKTADAAAVIRSSGGGSIFPTTKSKRGFPVAALAISVQNILKNHVSR